MKKIKENGLLTVFIAIIFITGLSIIVFVASNSLAKEKSIEMNVLNKLNWRVPLGKYTHLESSPDRPGFLVFQEDGFSGLLNKQGQVAVPALYNFISLKGEGDLFLCKGQGKSGYVDSFGRTVIPFAYDNAFDFHGGYAVTQQNSHYQVIDEFGGIVFENPDNYSLWPTEKKGYFTFWQEPASEDKAGNDVYNFYKGLLQLDENNPAKAHIIIKPNKYVGWFQYSEGFWLTETIPHPDLRIFVFLSDEDFQELFTDKIFHLAHPFSEGFAAVTTFVEDVDLANKQNLHIDKVGYMDHEGKILANDITFNASAPFKEGLASIFDHKGLYYIDKAGQVVIEIPRKDNFLYYQESFSEGFACVKVDKHWGYVDKKGDFIIPPIFQAAYPVLGNMAVVYYGGKFGAIEVK